jgi:hypothetical protein
MSKVVNLNGISLEDEQKEMRESLESLSEALAQAIEEGAEGGIVITLKGDAFSIQLGGTFAPVLVVGILELVKLRLLAESPLEES